MAQNKKIDQELKKGSGLYKRALTAAILAPITLLIVIIGGSLFNLIALIVTILMSFEYANIISNKKLSKKDKFNWQLLGVAYLSIFASSLIYLREREDGLMVVLFLFIIVWAVDIAAYFFGKIIGGAKIAPKISPNKTWAGLFGGMIAAGLVAVFFAGASDDFTMFAMFGLGMLVAIVAQGGDFFQSWIKRQFGVKDSGSIIPGHGGLLDRLDGLIAAAFFFEIVTFFYKSFF